MRARPVQAVLLVVWAAVTFWVVSVSRSVPHAQATDLCGEKDYQDIRWSGSHYDGRGQRDTLRIWQGEPFKCIFMSARDTFVVVVEAPHGK